MKKSKQVLIRVAETGKVILGIYDPRMIGWNTVDGFYNVGDAFPVK